MTQGEGGEYPLPRPFLKKIKVKSNFTRAPFLECSRSKSKVILRAPHCLECSKVIFTAPHWLDFLTVTRESQSRSHRKRMKGARLEHLSQTLPEQRMSHDQKQERPVTFQDQVQVLQFKKKQAVTNLLRSGKKDIPFHEGEWEFTKI